LKHSLTRDLFLETLIILRSFLFILGQVKNIRAIFCSPLQTVFISYGYVWMAGMEFKSRLIKSSTGFQWLASRPANFEMWTLAEAAENDGRAHSL